jgi:predicted amidohydrolase YtcJ
MKTRIIGQAVFFLGLLAAIFILPLTVSAATLLTPRWGEVITSGSDYTITWAASEEDVTCKIEYSIGKREGWQTIVDQYPAFLSSYDWEVIAPPNNKKCLLRITTYDARGRRRSVHRSSRFAIEILRLLEPDGQYPIRSESKKTIRWITHLTQKPVSYVQLDYFIYGGSSWKEIATLKGNPELYFWFVPESIKKGRRALVRVTLKDEDGRRIGRDRSDSFFQILEPTAARKTIFYNAQIITMERDKFVNGALLVNGNTIESLGTNKAILAQRDFNTLVVNVGGLTIIPGFIDPHTHLLNDAEWNGYSLDGVQWLALTNGITGVGNIGDLPEQIEHYIRYANDGNMRLRSYHYLCYNNHCGDLCEKNWHEKYLPKYEHAPNVWVNGIKLFVERSVCPSIMPSFSNELMEEFTDAGKAEWGEGKNALFLDIDDLANVIAEADGNEYQVAIHAIGDLGIQTTLEAIEKVLTDNFHRHMIFHNHFIRDDMLNSYADSDILAILEPARPGQAEWYAQHVGEENMKYFKRWQELLDSGAPIAGNSDWPYGSINPIRRIEQFVNNKVPDYIDREDHTLSVTEALRLMTIRSAYAMQSEKKTGSLKPGKLADLVILSDNPLEIDPLIMEDIQVFMVMVDGWVEYWNENFKPHPAVPLKKVKHLFNAK